MIVLKKFLSAKIDMLNKIDLDMLKCFDLMSSFSWILNPICAWKFAS